MCNPGRCECIAAADGRTWIVDVAHNPDGARFFAAQVAARFPKRRCRAIVGCLEDKDAAGICAALGAVAQDIAFADTGGARGAPARRMRAQAGLADAFAGTLDEALAHVLAASGGTDDAILVCGSFDLVERVRNYLLRPRPQDAPAC